MKKSILFLLFLALFYTSCSVIAEEEKNIVAQSEEVLEVDRSTLIALAGKAYQEKRLYTLFRFSEQAS